MALDPAHLPDDIAMLKAMLLSRDAEIETASVSVGLSAERVLQVSHGDTTLFAGSVGSIPAEFYAANQYQFGLFAYLIAIDDVEFEVINYWVER